ncbi:hypothetical protein NPIL_124261 [Nephila pilipes]|uniref:Secreted protein n=1 Tax=Nephila pilipes TaxID=299642 RepID=A0A8X6TIV9_NEPPI|nr:hypothetical protein NPIL_124261 [Nephila pilipes]
MPRRGWWHLARFRSLSSLILPPFSYTEGIRGITYSFSLGKHFAPVTGLADCVEKNRTFYLFFRGGGEFLLRGFHRARIGKRPARLSGKRFYFPLFRRRTFYPLSSAKLHPSEKSRRKNIVKSREIKESDFELSN